MHNALLVKVLHGGEHLTHDVGSVPLGEALSCDNPIEELAALAVLHDDVHVAMVDVALIELDDVGVVHGLQDSELFFEEADIFRDVGAENRLDGEGRLRISFERSKTHSAEMATTDHLDEVVDAAHVCS